MGVTIIIFITQTLTTISVYHDPPCSGFTTGGGFSNIYETPVWQKAALRDYYAQIQILSDNNVSQLPYVNATSTKSSRSYPYSNFNNKGRGQSSLFLRLPYFIFCILFLFICHFAFVSFFFSFFVVESTTASFSLIGFDFD